MTRPGRATKPKEINEEMGMYDDLPEPKRVPHPGECQICHTFRADGLPPTVHKTTCPNFVDQGVLRMADSATDPRRRFPR